MIISSVCLSVLFSVTDVSFLYGKWDFWEKFFYMTCFEVPFLMVFMAHWVIFY